MWIPCKELIEGGFRGWRPTLGEVFRIVRKGLLLPYNEDGDPLHPVALDKVEQDLFDFERRPDPEGDELAALYNALGKGETLEEEAWSRMKELEDGCRQVDEIRQSMSLFLDEHWVRPWESIPLTTPQEHKIESARIETQAYFMVVHIEGLLLNRRTESSVTQPLDWGPDDECETCELDPLGNRVPPPGGKTVPQLAKEIAKNDERKSLEFLAAQARYSGPVNVVTQLSSGSAILNLDSSFAVLAGTLPKLAAPGDETIPALEADGISITSLRPSAIDKARTQELARKIWAKDEYLEPKVVVKMILDREENGQKSPISRPYTVKVMADWIRKERPGYKPDRRGRFSKKK